MLDYLTEHGADRSLVDGLSAPFIVLIILYSLPIYRYIVLFKYELEDRMWFLIVIVAAFLTWLLPLVINFLIPEGVPFIDEVIQVIGVIKTLSK